MFVVFLEGTADKMADTREYFNEQYTWQKLLYTMYYISPPLLNSARVEQQRLVLNNKEITTTKRET